jgi:tRNA(fMet)-specific endonuclease VapC
MFVSVMAAYEFRFGARFSGRPSEMTVAEDLLSRFAIVPFLEADAEGAVQVRLALERKGRRIGAMDMLIAGHAVSRGWALVTTDVGDFSRIDGLKVIDWTTESP